MNKNDKMNIRTSDNFNVIFAEHCKNYDNHCRIEGERFELQYVAAGGVELWIDRKNRYQLRGGSGWLILPGHSYDYRPLSEYGCWDHRFIVFEGTVTRYWRDAGLFPEEPFHVLPELEFERRLDKIIMLTRNQQAGLNRLELVNLIERLFLDLHSPTREEQPEWLLTVLSHLELDRHPDYEGLAYQCGMSLRTFLRHFRQATGMAPHHYHLQFRIKNATRLLETTTLTTVEIAARLGFADAAHFTRQYRSITGRTPGELRRLKAPPCHK